MLLKTKDCPDANGRQPLHGEYKWTFNFPLENGDTLYLEMGNEGRDNLRHIIVDEMIDDHKEQARNRTMTDIPESMNRAVTLDLNQRGIEVTPQEVSELRESAYEKIRSSMRAEGWDMPDSDMALMELIRQSRLRVPATYEEIESIVPCPISDEQIDRIWKNVEKEIFRDTPFSVVGPKGGAIKRFKLLDDAERDCEDRNIRAIAASLNARYQVVDEAAFGPE